MEHITCCYVAVLSSVLVFLLLRRYWCSVRPNICTSGTPVATVEGRGIYKNERLEVRSDDDLNIAGIVKKNTDYCTQTISKLKSSKRPVPFN